MKEKGHGKREGQAIWTLHKGGAPSAALHGRKAESLLVFGR